MMHWAGAAVGFVSVVLGLVVGTLMGSGVLTDWLDRRAGRELRNTQVMNGKRYTRTCWDCEWIEFPETLGHGFEVRPCPKHAKWRP